ncbi:hypothetical protein CYLTODRAFT_455092 [Cylindrobasidium torrendii FP15055 ss-10]|uniref:DUF6532 domain-containing protein n=1 Tax=Cylindrobasidium torrendii FP15055 ss-10 TaxID=1314674 RepID=A0A0D7BB60_9AGAR|nr:hypothetical protein CYLTODRAFT_455092 [Cylindrobasidium torrendii FP15055 ss-10]
MSKRRHHRHTDNEPVSDHELNIPVQKRRKKYSSTPAPTPTQTDWESWSSTQAWDDLAKFEVAVRQLLGKLKAQKDDSRSRDSQENKDNDGPALFPTSSTERSRITRPASLASILFPEPLLESTWASANEEAGENIALDSRLRRLIRTKATHVRNDLVNIARAQIPKVYGFEEGDTLQVKKRNMQRYKNLIKDDAFAYKKCFVGDTGYLEHQSLSLILNIWGFSREHKPAELFSEYFSPLSQETLALFMTLIRFLLDEWQDGYFNKLHFMESEQKPIYESYLTDVKNWDGLVPPVTKNIRQKLYTKAKPTSETGHVGKRRTLGSSSLEAMRARLLERTGDTDDDDDSQHEGW